MEINAEAQAVIDRIAAVMAKPPRFNAEAITQCFKRQYELLV